MTASNSKNESTALMWENRGYIMAMKEDIKNTKDGVIRLELKIDSLFNKLEDDYVGKVEFKPIKQIVYGMVGFILVAVLGAIIGIVINTSF